MAQSDHVDPEICLVNELRPPHETQAVAAAAPRQKETQPDISDDHQLLRAYAQGDEQAFEKLVEKYFRMVYELAARHTADSHVAEDVAQSVFIILSRKAPGFSSRSSVAGWLLRTTHFVCRDAVKTRRRRQENERKLAAALEPQVEARPNPSAFELLLEEALRTLLPHEQGAIAARFFEGRNFREIAQMFDITERTARKRTSRSVAKLQRFMLRRGAKVSLHTLSSLLMLPSAHPAAPQALPSAIQALHGAWKGQAAGSKAAALADHTLRLLRWRFVIAVSLKIAAGALILSAGVWSAAELNQPIPARIEKLGRAWAALDRYVAQQKAFLMTTPPTAPNYQARIQQGLGAISRDSSRVITELSPLLAPPDDRNRLAIFLTAELTETLKLAPAQKAALFSYIENRLAQGATLKDGMKLLAQTTPTEAPEIRATLSPEQRQLFDQIYGADGVLLFSYAKVIALGQIGP